MPETMLMHEDINWVYETFLKDVAEVPGREQVQCAILNGSPEAPTSIDLYPNEIPNVGDSPIAQFVPEEDMKFVRVQPTIWMVEVFDPNANIWEPTNKVGWCYEHEVDELVKRLSYNYPGDKYRAACYGRKFAKV